MSDPIRLGLLASSPVHYQAPLYRLLAADPRFDFTAIFASTSGARPGEFGYGRPVMFDQAILEGYRHLFLKGARDDRNLDSTWALRDPDVVRRVVRGRYDVLWLHGYNHVVHMLAVMTQAALGRPVMFREVQTTIHTRSLPKRVVKPAALRALFRNRHALYVGTESRLWFEQFGVTSDRLHFAPYAVDNQRLQGEAERLRPERPELRREFGLDPEKPVVLSVSRLIERKQPQRVLEAFERVRARADCSLLLVGDGSLSESMDAEIRSRGIEDVVMTGFIPQEALSRAYACADVFTLFSAWDETWGAVVNEAMNFELPVVVSDRVGCHRDLVRHGENGLVVPHDDEDALAAALEGLLADADRRSAFGRRSLELIDDWNYEAAAEGVAEAVGAVVGAERWARAAQARSR